MPRLPVDGKKVIEHRITLGSKERQLLDNVATSYSINKIATPLVSLISDVSALAFLTSIYIAYKYGPDKIEWLKDKYESVEELAKDVTTIVESETVGKIIEGQRVYETLEEYPGGALGALFAGTPLAPIFRVI